MKARYNARGEAVLTMTRAEAHVFIWGGPQEVYDAVGWNARHALVAAEDAVDSGVYEEIMREVAVLKPALVPDPRG